MTKQITLLVGFLFLLVASVPGYCDEQSPGEAKGDSHAQAKGPGTTSDPKGEGKPDDLLGQAKDLHGAVDERGEAKGRYSGEGRYLAPAKKQNKQLRSEIEGNWVSDCILDPKAPDDWKYMHAGAQVVGDMLSISTQYFNAPGCVGSPKYYGGSALNLKYTPDKKDWETFYIDGSPSSGRLSRKNGQLVFSDGNQTLNFSKVK